MTLPRIACRYPAYDRTRVDHTFGVTFDAVADLEIVWSRGGTTPVVRVSGLSLLGLVRTRKRPAPGAAPPPPVVGLSFAQALLDLIESDSAEPNGWNVTRNLIPISAVVRTSDFVVTVTLPPLQTYAIATLETLTATAPGEGVTTLEPITGQPEIPVTP